MYYERLLSKRKSDIIIQPEALLKAAAEYFEWCEEHPLLESKVFQNKGTIVEAEVPKMRPFTMKGLANWLGMTSTRLAGMAGRGGEWVDALERIEEVVYTQKFDGAATGLLNASLIARDLGLAEKKEIAEQSSAVVAVVDDTPDEHKAVHVHPMDPNPLNLPRPLYSKAQIAAGIAFTPPEHDAA
jgi:hypothetical protein